MRTCTHGAVVPRGQQSNPVPGGRFGRMFPQLPAGDLGDDAIRALVKAMAAASAAAAHPDSDVSTNNRKVPAGYTYLGQFVDHDITFDPTSQLQRDNDPHAVVNFRTPRFDLDSMYGSGPADQPYLYDWDEERPHPGVRLLTGCNPPGFEPHDLPRNEQGRALIGDARNDENLVVSQLHLLFIDFHNKVVQKLATPPGRLDDDALLVEAQRIVRWHYQWIVMHDFLEKIVGEAMAQDVLRPATEDSPPTVVRRFFDWTDEPAIPVEFSGAAFRLGHSMVRDSYHLNRDTGVALFLQPPADAPPGTTPDPPPADSAESRHMGGLRRLPKDHGIDWGRFLLSGIDTPTMWSQTFDHVIVKPLFHLPDGRALPLLNLRRGRALGLPSGRDIARAMGEIPLEDDELFPSGKTRRPDGSLEAPLVLAPGAREAISAAPPLWLYILREADSRCAGRHLGPVGGRIVAEVLAGLLEADPNSYLSQWPRWQPTLGDEPGVFTMVDLVKFTEGSISATGLGSVPRPSRCA